MGEFKYVDCNRLELGSLDILHKMLGFVYEINDGKITKAVKEN